MTYNTGSGFRVMESQTQELCLKLAVGCRVTVG